MKPSNKQTLIHSFFAPRDKKPLKIGIPTSLPLKPLSTPEKILKRSDSVLSRVSQTDGFDEISSSDTSFDSPEINNFKHPVLSLFVSKTTEYSSKGVLVKYDTSRKRTAASILDSLSQESYKVPKLKPKAGKSASQRQRLSPSYTSMDLSKEQQHVVTQIVDKKKNVFYTGSAGTGKSVVLRELVRRLHALYGSDVVGVTASTGLAACNIGGQTIHRYLGIGIGNASPQVMKNIIEKKAAFKRKWQRMKVLIIDEISMIDGVLFSKLEELARLLRNSSRPFGGIQIVCTGDFFQLPPVNKAGQAQYCFESPAWRSVIDKTILLTQVFRQKGDTELIDMLNSLRFGELDSPMVDRFFALQKEKKYDDGIEPTELFPTREEVKRANDRRLQGILHSSRTFTAEDSTQNEFDIKLLDNLMCERSLTLKPGAQVMYLKNRDDGIVNGSIGKVLFFATAKIFYHLDVLYDLSFLQDDAVMQEVLLLTSRIGKPVADFTPTEQAVLSQIPPERKPMFDLILKEAVLDDPNTQFPVVQFMSVNSSSTILVTPEDFIIDAGSGSKREITRTQLPLLLSWAMSIHKSQGQTIQRLRVDLKRIFEKGQVYVALSRAVDKENLEIRNFDPKKIIASDKVKQFYNNLDTVA